MTLDLMVDFAPTYPYRRSIEGADFSLEANTDAAPEPGHFYVLRRGKAVFRSDRFPEALDYYHRLCQELWRKRLKSRAPGERLGGAWGLLGLQPDDPDAMEVIRVDGSPADRHRMEQLRRRAHAATRRPGRPPNRKAA